MRLTTYIRSVLEGSASSEMEDEEKWMQDVNPKKGALHQQLGIPQDQKIPTATLKAAADKGGVLGKRANLALRYRGESSTDDPDSGRDKCKCGHKRDDHGWSTGCSECKCKGFTLKSYAEAKIGELLNPYGDEKDLDFVIFSQVVKDVLAAGKGKVQTDLYPYHYNNREKKGARPKNPPLAGEGALNSYTEVTDTECREMIMGAVRAFMQNGTTIPDQYGMFSPGGDAAVKRALAKALKDNSGRIAKAKESMW